MDEKEAWKYFEKTGSVEAYLLYSAYGNQERDAGHDAQSQGYIAPDRANDS